MRVHVIACAGQAQFWIEHGSSSLATEGSDPRN